MKLHSKQSEVIKSNKRFKLLNWGRRSGKTTVIAYEAFITLWNTDKGLVSYYAPTRDDARDIAWEIFKETFGSAITDTNEVRMEITVANKFGTESICRLAGWESVKNREKGRGVENDLLILDEVAFYPEFNAMYEKVLEPTLLTSKGRQIWSSTPNGFNHFHEWHAKALNDPEMWFVSHATSYDNEFNDPLELARLKKDKDPDVFAQEYLADFRKVQGLVYKDFDREKHTYGDDAVFPKLYEIVGIDWGFRNPLAMLRIYIDNDNVFFIDEEYYQVEKTTQEAIQYLKSWSPKYVYPDNAEQDRLKELKDAGFYVQDINKDKKNGIDKVQGLIRNGQVMINRRCVNLIAEMESYRYDPDSPIKEEPLKENDHAMDAMRYALFMNAETFKKLPVKSVPKRANAEQTRRVNRAR